MSGKLNEENKVLRKELERYRQFRIPQSLTNPTQTDRPNKRLKKSKEKSPEEPNEIGARVILSSIIKFLFLFEQVYNH